MECIISSWTNAISSFKNMSGHQGFNWGYSNENGPHTWAKHFPNAAGSRQSPILISTAQARRDEGLVANPLKISIGDPGSQSITNNGHGFRVDIKTDEITISGGPLDSVYRIEQFHFHWGECSGWGSEHLIDGQGFASELHCVFWNTRYANFNEAAGKSDGLAVLGTLIQEGSHNPAMESLILELPNIPCNEDVVKLRTPVSVRDILPENIDDYFTYQGSLTTPPCNESVTWHVFKEPITMSCKQLSEFRSIRIGGMDSDFLVDNFRPPCPLGSRQLNCSF